MAFPSGRAAASLCIENVVYLGLQGFCEIKITEILEAFGVFRAQIIEEEYFLIPEFSSNAYNFQSP
jgi:hypothetical protein